MHDEALNAIAEGGSSGVLQSQLFAGKVGGNAAVNLTNTLAQMRRNGEVVLRREVRDGVPVRVYYTADNAPALPTVGEGS
jgi:hypothetical protein